MMHSALSSDQTVLSDRGWEQTVGSNRNTSKEQRERKFEIEIEIEIEIERES